MITARFPTGLTVQYNSATTVVWAEAVDRQHRIYAGNKETGSLIACVPSDCIIEWVAPCRVYHAGDDPEKLFEAVLEALRKRPQISAYGEGYILKDIKRELAHFDATRRAWRKV